jgi:hypothetical protein
MPFVLLLVGILFFVVALQGTQGSLFSLLKSEFVGTNSFVVWAAAFVIIGLLGYIRPIRPITHAFLVLMLLVLILTNGKGFFSQFNAALRSPVAPASAASSTSSSASSSPGAIAAPVSSSNFLGNALPDVLTGAPQ